MELREAISDAHCIAEKIHNYAKREELANLLNYIIDSAGSLLADLDVICKRLPEDKWIPTSERLPKTNKLVWVYSNSCGVDVCKIHPCRDGNWYSANDECLYYGEDIMAWRPCLLPEPYVPEEAVVENIWHPASEDPPKKYSHYWVQLCDSNGNYVGMHDCVWTDSGFFSQYKTNWHWNGNPQYTKIVAWRPLPERFIGDEDGNG